MNPITHPSIASIGFLALSGSALAQQTSLVSLTSTGTQVTDAASEFPSIAAGGLIVAFETRGALDPNDLNSFPDVYVRDRVTGSTELVSLRSNGSPSAFGWSTRPSISGDGRFVAFMSAASDLVPNDLNQTRDVFVRDRVAGTTTLVSPVSVATVGGRASGDPSISSDGRYIAFDSFGDLPTIGDTNGKRDVFLFDQQTGAVELISQGSGGNPGDGDSWDAAVSADGRFVAFASYADLAIGNYYTSHIYVRDRLTGTTRLADRSLAFPAEPAGAMAPSISADGRWVSYSSAANDLAPGDGNVNLLDVFVTDLLTGTVELVSVTPQGVAGNGPSRDPSISIDGRYVTFASAASDLLQAGADSNGHYDVFLRDRQLGTTERLSVGPTGAQGTSNSLSPSISADGRSTAMTSQSMLVPSDANGWGDVYVRDLPLPYATFCHGDGIDTSHVSQCPCGNTGAPGNGCANSFAPGGASLRTSGLAFTDTVVLLAANMPTTSTCIYLQGDAIGDAVFGDGVRCVGGTIRRLATKTNAGGASSFPDASDVVTLATRGSVVPLSGVRRYYQTYYRNFASQFCPPASFNITNGVVIDW